MHTLSLLALLALLSLTPSHAFTFSSTSFHNNTEIPLRHTCNGMNVNPGFYWQDLPSSSDTTIAITLIDLDGDKDKDRIHWVAWGIPSSDMEFPADKQPPHFGTTDFKHSGGYRGPCLETGTVHRFVFTAYVVDSSAELSQLSIISELKDLQEKIKGHVLAKSKLYFVCTGHTFASDDAHKAIEAEAAAYAEQLKHQQAQQNQQSQQHRGSVMKGKRGKQVEKGNPKLKTTIDKDLLCYGCLSTVQRGFQRGAVLTRGRQPLKEEDAAEILETLCDEENLNEFAYPPQEISRVCRFFLSEFEEKLDRVLRSDQNEVDGADEFCREKTGVCDGYTDDDILRMINEGPKESLDQAGRTWSRTAKNKDGTPSKEL